MSCPSTPHFITPLCVIRDLNDFQSIRSLTTALAVIRCHNDSHAAATTETLEGAMCNDCVQALCDKWNEIAKQHETMPTGKNKQ